MYNQDPPPPPSRAPILGVTHANHILNPLPLRFDYIISLHQNVLHFSLDKYQQTVLPGLVYADPAESPSGGKYIE